MKKVYLPILLCLLITIPLIISCSIPPASSASSGVASLTTRLTDVEAVNKTQNESLEKQQQNIQELYDKKLSKTDYTGSTDTYAKTDLYTRAEVEQKIADAVAKLKSDQSWVTGNSGSSGSSGSSGNTASGQINYSVTNPQSYYQFTTSGNYPLQIRVFNNKSDARYIRLQLTTTTLNSQNAGTVTGPTATVMSNSQGQAAVAFLPTATPTGAVNTVLFIANSGGVSSSGEYLLSSGGQMDIYITIAIPTTNAVLWNLVVSGSDRPVS